MKLFKRPPDFVIGSPQNPYLLRWYMIPKNSFFNIYLHKFCRSDDDRAQHDHPWSWNISVILKGAYIEHMPLFRKGFGSGDNFRITTRLRRPWRPIFRRGTTPHRVELLHEYITFVPRWSLQIMEEKPVWTLFITGPRVRDWGFYCPKGWRRWQDFVSVRDKGNDVGKGCND